MIEFRPGTVVQTVLALTYLHKVTRRRRTLPVGSVLVIQEPFGTSLYAGWTYLTDGSVISVHQGEVKIHDHV